MDCLLKLPLLFRRQRLFSNVFFEAVFQLLDLPVLWIGENFHRNGKRFCRGQDHQRLPELVGAIFHKADTFPEMPPPLAAAMA